MLKEVVLWASLRRRSLSKHLEEGEFSGHEPGKAVRTKAAASPGALAGVGWTAGVGLMLLTLRASAFLGERPLVLALGRLYHLPRGDLAKQGPHRTPPN